MAAPGCGHHPLLSDFADVCDQVVLLESPDPFYAVGEWYRDFSPTSDAEVEMLLQRAGGPAHAGSAGDDSTVLREDVEMHREACSPPLVAWLVPNTGLIPGKGRSDFAGQAGSSRSAHTLGSSKITTRDLRP